jgi:hypothetical protein
VLRGSWDTRRKVERIEVLSLSRITLQGDIMMTLAQRPELLDV